MRRPTCTGTHPRANTRVCKPTHTTTRVQTSKHTYADIHVLTHTRAHTHRVQRLWEEPPVWEGPRVAPPERERPEGRGPGPVRTPSQVPPPAGPAALRDFSVHLPSSAGPTRSGPNRPSPGPHRSLTGAPHTHSPSPRPILQKRPERLQQTSLFKRFRGSQ